MKRISFYLIQGFRIIAIALSATLIFAPFTANSAMFKSYRLQHPIAGTHMLPTGEAPGWNGKKWVQFDISHANTWNAPINLRNTENDKLLYYTADFEQTDYILEVGAEISEMWAHAIEIPYHHRDGGFLDRFIDDFHIAFGFDRFNRNEFPENQNNYEIRTDGEQQVEQRTASGVGNFRYKLKFWPWQLRGNSGQCPCGFSTNIQVKIPADGTERGLTTGELDYSAGWSLGFPVFNASSFWISSAVTYTEKNPFFEDWPRKKWHQMYEISSDFAMNDNWGFVLQIRMESPILDKSKLTILNVESDPEDQLLERIASGWNSLVHWRGSEAIGFRWRSDDGMHNFQMHLIEDWALGNFDEVGDDLYINNAPDVVFGLQYHYSY